MWIFVLRRSLVFKLDPDPAQRGPDLQSFSLYDFFYVELSLISPLGFEQSGLFRDQREVPSRTRGWGRGIWAGGGFKRSGKSKIFHLISLLRVDPYASLWTLWIRVDPYWSLFICVQKSVQTSSKFLFHIFHFYSWEEHYRYVVF